MDTADSAEFIGTTNAARLVRLVPGRRLQKTEGLDEALREIVSVQVPPAENEGEYVHQRVIYRLREIAMKALGIDEEEVP